MRLFWRQCCFSSRTERFEVRSSSNKSLLNNKIYIMWTQPTDDPIACTVIKIRDVSKKYSSSKVGRNSKVLLTNLPPKNHKLHQIKNGQFEVSLHELLFVFMYDWVYFVLCKPSKNGLEIWCFDKIPLLKLENSFIPRSTPNTKIQITYSFAYLVSENYHL